MTRILVHSCLAVLLMLPVAVFGGQNPDAEVALDCRAHDRTRACGGIYSSCTDVQYEYSGTGDYDIIVVLYGFEGVTAVEYTLDYSGLADAEFGGYTSCSSLDIEEPEPGYFTVAHAWTTCQSPPSPGGGITVGWIRLYGGAGEVDVVPSRTSGYLRVLDCDFELDPILIGHAGFVGGAYPGQGYVAPCGEATAVEGKTWGGVKSLYR
jgi:hypothetical protein